VIELTEHVGAEQARNIGAGEANGRALLFLDADNVLPPDYLARMVPRLNNDCPFVYPGGLNLFGDVAGALDTHSPHYSSEGTRTFPEWGAQNLRDQNYCESCSLIWREAFDQAGGWWAGFGHMPDWHLFLRLSTFGTPARAPVALGYRIHGESWSEQSKRARPNWEEELRREILASVDEWAAARRRPQLVMPELVEPPVELPTRDVGEVVAYGRVRDWLGRYGRDYLGPKKLLQNLFEFGRLLALLEFDLPRAVIEIGTHQFGSARLLLDLLPSVDRLVTIDSEQRVTLGERLDIERRYGDRLRFLRRDSLRLSMRDSAAAALGDQADLLVIDGAHGYRWVAQDFALYSRLVRPRGLIAIHDIAGEPEVALFWSRLKRAEPNQCAEIIGPAGPWGAMGWGIYRA
jgi:glycosyltransferase involved in cell wall biosynthesis